MRRASLAIVSCAAFVVSPMVVGQEPGGGPATLEVSGSLAPDHRVKVASSVPGRIVRVHAEMGQRVRAGELLAELNDAPLRLKRELARADLELAQARLAEASAVVGAGRGDRSPVRGQLADAQARVKRAEAALAVAEQRLSEAKVQAPIDGTILTSGVAVGDVVDPSDPKAASLFELADLSKLIAVVQVPERFAPRVQRGQRARVAVDALNDGTIAGEVARISPVIGPSTRSFVVHIAIEAPAEGVRLMPGMFARVQILLKE